MRLIEVNGAVSDVSVAWGNIILCDHGGSLPEREILGQVPKTHPVLTPVVTD